MEIREEDKMPRVLVVDDEENILLSIKRLLADENWEVATARSGDDGLRLLQGKNDIAVIVSDQRMPGMSGVEFLQKAKEISPDAIRIVLTGYADMNATVDAINKGGASRYLNKPWNDGELVQVIRECLDKYNLIQENKRLNQELQEWNRRLKERVLEQTTEIRKRNEELSSRNSKLKETYRDIIRAFSTIMDFRNRGFAMKDVEVADIAEQLAKMSALSPEEVEAIRVAALLRNLGEIGTPERLMEKKPEEMGNEELSEASLHPVRGQTAVDMVEALRPAALIIRHHHERFDGAGFPDKLRGEDIPIGSRILAAAEIVAGFAAATPDVGPALLRVKKEFGKSLDPALGPSLEVVVREYFSTRLPGEKMVEVELAPKDLVDGMVLAKDIFSGTGLLLLGKGVVLDEQKIQALRRYYLLDPPKEQVHVLMKR